MRDPYRTLLLAGLLATLTWSLSRSALAHDGHEHAPPKPVPDAEAHRPTAIPDRIIRTFAGDPARSIAVTWRTDAAVEKAVAQIAPADAGPKFAARARTVDARSTTVTTDLGNARCHSVVFDDLGPAQLYAYRVGDGVNWSEWVHAATASDKPEPFAFIYFGDAQNDLKSLWSRVIRGAYSDAPKARFIIHAGDLVNRANKDAEWGEWFGAGGWVNAMVPSVPTPGNHEYERPQAPQAVAAGPQANGAPKAERAENAAAELSRHWRPQFTLPEHGPEGLSETVYYIDYQGVRIICLNSNEKQEAQVGWLEEVLKNNPNTWTVITFHHPIYSAAKERDNPELRELWQPVFDRYKVDLVLQGHDHTYARSGLRTYENVPTGVSRRDDAGGTVYVVSVSGPKMYELDKSEWMQRSAEDTQLYQIVLVDGNRLKYEARTAVGDLYDAFDLRKRPGRPNELVERIPDTPERHRPAAARREAEAKHDRPANQPAPPEPARGRREVLAPLPR
jgi:3',5'-cyclic AMP phosphodiesterase CpdA